MKRNLFLIICIFLSFSCQEKENVTPLENQPVLTGILSTLRKDHPRLMLSASVIEEIKSKRKNDALLDKYASAVIASANSIVNKAPLARVLTGPRLLSVSRELLHRVTHLSLAFHLTSDPRFLDAAVSQMKTVCAFSDWNPSHFLDVAEMTNGVAIGYDWLYNHMKKEDAELIRSGLKTKGLEEYKKAYDGAWWSKGDNNWNQVCHGGLIVGALAIAETDPAYATTFIPKALANLPYSNKYYAPDGAWYEGPGYWSYATEYLAYAMSALKSALGNMGNLENTKGLENAGFVPMICAGPSNYILNFADSGENSKATTSPAMLFLSNLYDKPLITNYLHGYMKSSNALANVFHVVWYKAPTSEPLNLPLDQYLDGEINELILLRSSWTDPNATWIGMKSGVNSSPHSHLDIGNFEMEAGGVRWAKDLGSDDYNLNGYWTMGVNGKRWTYYRLNSFSHNVPLLGGKNQFELAKARFIQKELNVPVPSATLDMTDAYKDFSSKSLRKISLTDQRKNVLIEDSFTLIKTTEVAWGMLTGNAIELLNGGKAILRNATITSKWLELEIISPKGAAFSEESAIQKAPEKTNTGHSRLMVRLPNQSGNVNVTVKMTIKNN